MNQDHKQKIEFIRSLELGDVVIAGSHIGAIRYLGPLEGPQYHSSSPDWSSRSLRIHDLFAGIELTEPIGHMDGSMMINGQSIRYFEPTLKHRTVDTILEEHKETDSEWALYGVLIPAVSIQRKIDPFSLLRKTTMIFEEYKAMRKQMELWRHRMGHKTSSALSTGSHPNIPIHSMQQNTGHLHRQYRGRTASRKVK